MRRHATGEARRKFLRVTVRIAIVISFPGKVRGTHRQGADDVGSDRTGGGCHPQPVPARGNIAMTANPHRQPDREASKDAWREWARAVGRTLDWPSLSTRVCRSLRTFPPLRHGSTVLTYLPMSDEIDLGELMAQQPNNRWLATRTPEEGPLTIHELGGPLERHPFGFAQPLPSAPHVDPDRIEVVLVPGLAFDLYGHRLGHGHGYYDELLARIPPHTVRIGVIPATLVADRLPTQHHDQRVQWLAAEEGVVDAILK